MLNAAIALLLLGSLGVSQAIAQSGPSLLLAGNWLRVRIANDISTKTARQGERVDAILIKTVKRAGSPLLPAGARFRGSVAEVRSADRKSKNPAFLRLEFSELTLPDGRKIPAKLSLRMDWRNTPDSSSKMAKLLVPGGILVATVVGAIAAGGKGAAVGPAIGSGLGVLCAVAFPWGRWQDFEIRKVRTVTLFLDQDLPIPTAPPSQP